MLVEPYVSEKNRKKKQSREKSANERIFLKKKIKKRTQSLKSLKLKNSEKFIINNLQRKNNLLEEKNLIKKMNKFIIPSKEKIFFVIRIRGINGISPRAKKILELLRLNQINNGVFIKINSSTSEMLRKIEPYIAYGYPSIKSIKNLVEKRGHGKIGKRGCWQRILLPKNGIIEPGISDFKIYNTQTIINEIFTCGPRFREINNFLWPFKLRSPMKGYSNIGKTRHFSEGGAYGNWEENINKLIKKMN